jgi:glutathione S-transferase
MKLYDWQGAPNPRRVLMFLKEKNIDMPVIEAGAEGAKLSDTFLANHGQRTVPALELDDGTLIGEAMVICRYLETLHPEPPLLGTDALDSAKIDMWERRADMEGIGAVSELFRNSHPAFVGRGLPGWAERIEQIPELVERGRTRMNWLFEKFDKQIGDNPFVTGKSFTVADITAFCATDFACKVCKVQIPDSYGNFTRWYESVRARPSAER